MKVPKDKIVVAIPKGKLGDKAFAVLKAAGLPVEGIEEDSRKLSYEYPNQHVKYLICRPTDIPVYVEYGAADIGIVGKDTLEETDADVFELVDLGFGYCKFVVALPQTSLDEIIRVKGTYNIRCLNGKRVATKFPRIAEKYFSAKGLQVEVVKLHGNIELAPAVGLAEMIVDLVSTGRTLKENNLIAVEEIFEATARLIANRVSYKMKNARILELANNCQQLIHRKEMEKC
jgi:ATP phosphoribosyltransferase